MTTLNIQLDRDATQYAPGEAITGRVDWRLSDAAEFIELRLVWYTEGKGTQDAKIVHAERFAHPMNTDDKAFKLAAPPGPYSYDGKLIAILWALEATTDAEDHAARQVITIRPHRPDEQMP